MKPARLYLAILVVFVFAFAVVAGWRIVGQMQAERYAQADPERALGWRPDHPQALLVLAERQLAEGRFAESRASARRLLAHEPLQGVAFRLLAAAADREGRQDDAWRLYLIAEKRAPRDLQTRAWLTQRYLEQGNFAEALGQIDRILRMAPQRARSINPVLAQLATEPAFAEALAARLRQGPPWRADLLNSLRDPRAGNPVAVGRVMQALQNQGGLKPEEYAQWLDNLMTQGRWGEAYARWAGPLPKPAGRLPLVYNGNFAQPPSGVGFDWRLRRIPGVILQFEPESEAGGQVAYLHFLDRRVPNAGLEQALLLSPGSYRLSVRMRARALRSELGLQWTVQCQGPAGVAGRTDAIDGSFAWRTFEADITIPAAGCPGQWLRLVNPVPSGAAQRVVGEAWLDDVRLVRQR